VSKRPTWDQQHMDMAKLASRRATCDRAHVGCVIVLDNRVVSTGYNGSLPGTPHCDDAGHLMHEGHCIRTVHAEGNALADAASRGAAVKGATAYCTHAPCPYCLKLLLAAGIVRVVYAAAYGDMSASEALCVASGVMMESAAG